MTLKERRATVVLVTHRLNILRHADRVMVIENGEVARFGPARRDPGRADPSGARGLRSMKMASPTKAAAAVERAASFRGPLLAAAAILLVFFGGFGTWAVLVPLSGAAIAPAVVAPEGFRKTDPAPRGRDRLGDPRPGRQPGRGRRRDRGPRRHPGPRGLQWRPGAVRLHARPQRPTGGRADRRGDSRVRRRSGRGGARRTRRCGP